MLEKKNVEVFDKDRFHQIVLKVGPDVENIFHQFKTDLGGKLPEEMSYGMVAGYLRGKGYTWEECFVGMDKFISVMKQLIKPEPIDGTLKIGGNPDGSVNFNLENNK